MAATIEFKKICCVLSDTDQLFALVIVWHVSRSQEAV